MSQSLIFECSGAKFAHVFRAQIIWMLRFMLGSLGLLVGTILVHREEVIFIGVAGALFFICSVYAALTDPVRWAFRIVLNSHSSFRIRLSDDMIEQELAGYDPVRILHAEVDKIFEGQRGGLVVQSRKPKRSVIVPLPMPGYEEMCAVLKSWGFLVEVKQLQKKVTGQILSRPLMIFRFLGALVVVMGLVIISGQITLLLVPSLVGIFLAELVNGVLVFRIQKTQQNISNGGKQ